MPQPRTAPRRSLRSPGFCPAPLVPIPGTSHRHRLEENAAAVSRFETIDQKAATGSWHWFFLIQGHGLPEHMIGGDPEFFLRHMFGTLLHDEDAIEPAAWTEYLRCFRHSETIRATCDEYRARHPSTSSTTAPTFRRRSGCRCWCCGGPTAGRGAAMTSSGYGATMPATCAATASIAATLSQRSSRTRSVRR